MRSIKASLSLLFILPLLGIKEGHAQSLYHKIEAGMEQFRASPQARYALTSLTVLNAQTGGTVYKYNGQVGLPTASTLKTITAATAYYILGKDFTYETGLLYTGQIKNDTLLGDIVIRGSGDPTLGSWRYPETKPQVILSKWAKSVKQAGIRFIQGRIIGDASLFDSQMTPGGWPWQDMGNYYGAGSSGLTWHENQYDLFLLPGNRKGDHVKFLKTEPEIDQLEFVNELKTGGPHSGDCTYIYAAPYGQLAFLRGTSPAKHADFSVSGSIPDPALFVAGRLRNELQEKGVTVSKPSSTYRLMRKKNSWDPGLLTLLTTHSSPELKAISHWFLKKSINLYGEDLLKTIAVKKRKSGTTENGIKTVIDFWKKRGIDKEALHIYDGSGLSPSTRVTTEAIASVLYQVKKEKWFSQYYENLPIIHNIHMKSGHIRGVAAYSGFLHSAEGTPLIFSFIIDNYSGPSSRISSKIFRLLDQFKR